ncbi:MAG: reverse transcriptase domain-containing protein [Eubacterium sp.]
MPTFYEKVYDYENLEKGFKQTQIGDRKYKTGAFRLASEKEYWLVKLWRALKNKEWRPGRYIEFYVYEPKARLVHAPHTIDKIVQFSTHLVLQEIYRPVFIKDSYACLEGKGTHRAVDRIQHMMRLAAYKYENPYIIKADVRKFFYSIDRERLKEIYRKKIPPDEVDFLKHLDMIVDSSPEGERGLPLGNVTSQDFSNIYLNELDQFCKRYLHTKWYVRYMDDITVIVKDKETAREVLKKMTAFVEDHLHLVFNQKTHIYPISQGINTLGFKIYTTHKLVRNQSKAGMKRRIKAMDKKLKAGILSEERVTLAVNSWLGHARHSNSYNLSRKIFEKYPYINIEDKNWKFGERHLKK